MTKRYVIFTILIIIGVIYSGCITDQSSSNKNKSVSERDAWYNLADLVTPGYYAEKLSKDLKLGTINEIIDEINPIDALKSLIPGYEENAFKGSIENLLKSWDSSVSASTIDSLLLVAQADCVDPNIKFSDTGEIMRLPAALKHFGDLYGDNNPNTKPTIEDLENAKKKVKCYNYEFTNTNTKVTPEMRYLVELTTNIEKLIDVKIQSFSESATAESVQNLKSDSPAATNPDQTTANIAQKTITNSISMEFVLIPAGEFDMGSPSNEKDRRDDEGSVHHVKISKAFYMGKYEVTQKQWRGVMGTNPAHFEGDNLPVEQVSWDDAQEFIRKLNEKEGTNKYRLPSEAEWEYAARAGTTTRYSFGDDESKLGDYAWYGANSGSKTHEFGQKKPNPWVLYDMHGNVWEWVQDTWHNSYNGAPTDGSAWEGDSSHSPLRIFRGGGWGSYAWFCRSAYRDANNDDQAGRSAGVGFRLLRIS